MTAPASPQQVIAENLIGNQDHRDSWAMDILKALAEHGYAVVSVVEPEEPVRSEPAGCVGD